MKQPHDRLLGRGRLALFDQPMEVVQLQRRLVQPFPDRLPQLAELFRRGHIFAREFQRPQTEQLAALDRHVARRLDADLGCGAAQAEEFDGDSQRGKYDGFVFATREDEHCGLPFRQGQTRCKWGYSRTAAARKTDKHRRTA